MANHYCCYFDHRYLARGLAMIRSLRSFDSDCVVWVLCLSAKSEDALIALEEPGVHTIPLSTLELSDPELASVKPTRSTLEYFFTCTPALVAYLLDRLPLGCTLTYVDGDLFFFSDPRVLLDSMKDGSVAMIRHRFPAKNVHLERFGTYNVGWLSFRNNDDGKLVSHWWRSKCIEWCFDRLEEGENGRYADQKYLDHFADISPRVVDLSHPGANLAPWNVDRHAVTHNGRDVWVDGRPLIFFHFHGVKQLGRHWYFADHETYNAAMPPVVRKYIYGTYFDRLTRTRAEVRPYIGEESIGLILRRGGEKDGAFAALRSKIANYRRFVRLAFKGQAFHV